MTLDEMKALSPDKQKELFAKLSKVRAAGKATGYACQYSAGPATIARTAKVDLKTAKKLHTAYWKLNWSIQEIAKRTITKKACGGTWQKNPFNGFWYPLRAEKDRISTLIQGSGSYVLDIWLLFIEKACEKRGIPFILLGQIHDELIIEIELGKEHEYSCILKESMSKVNKHMKMRRELDCDIQTGSDYSQIH